MIRFLSKILRPSDADLTKEMEAAEQELRRSREEHAYSVNQRIDLEPLITEAKQVACQTKATLERNGWTDLLIEQMAGKKR